jgi:PilZ domain
MAADSSNKPTRSLDRIAPRYAFEARVKIRLQRGQENLILDGWARDLSESGLGAFVAQELKLEEHVTIEIPLNRTVTVTIPAKVALCLGTQYGFQFTALSTNQRQHIQSTVHGRKEIPGVGNR